MAVAIRTQAANCGMATNAMVRRRPILSMMLYKNGADMAMASGVRTGRYEASSNVSLMVEFSEVNSGIDGEGQAKNRPKCKVGMQAAIQIN